MTPWSVALQVPLSMEFSRQEYWSGLPYPRQEYWSGLPYPSPGDLPNPGIQPGSPRLKADSLPSEPPEFRGIKFKTEGTVKNLVFAYLLALGILSPLLCMAFHDMASF